MYLKISLITQMIVMKMINDLENVINSSSFATVVRILIDEAEGNFYTLEQLNNLWIDLYE